MGKTVYTKITPLPSNIPRQLALELLHSHEEVIKLNPLVTGVKSIDAPRDASTDEYYSTWYEISQIIAWGLGIKSKYSFKGVFHDQPWGLQTHVYAPMGVDMRNKYRIGGNQPGEPREARELGIDTPLDGLYLREDVEIVCNMAMMSIVKKEAKEATGIMISRLTRKAELLDEGKLHAMFEDGKLKTTRASGRGDDMAPMSPTGSDPCPSPRLPYREGGSSPAMSSASFGPSGEKRGYGNYHEVARNSNQNRAWQTQNTPPQGYNGGQFAPGQHSSMPMINELPGSFAAKPQGGAVFRSELPGDNNFAAHAHQTSPRLDPPSSPRPQPSTMSSQPSAYPAPLHPHHSHRNSSYGRPPAQNSPDSNRLSAPSANGDGWQRQSVSSESSSRYSGQLQPDSAVDPEMQARFQRMSFSQPQVGSGRPVNKGLVKCPVCGLFDGDEQAVNHHVNQAHFA